MYMSCLIWFMCIIVVCCYNLIGYHKVCVVIMWLCIVTFGFVFTVPVVVVTEPVFFLY